MKFSISFTVKAVVIAACVFLLIHYGDFREISASLRLFSVADLIILSSLYASTFIFSAFRLAVLAGDFRFFRASLSAVLLGLFFNNLLPARLGEVAKGWELKRHTGLSAQAILMKILSERVYDFLALFLLSSYFAADRLPPRYRLLVPALLVTGVVFLILLQLYSERLRAILTHGETSLPGKILLWGLDAFRVWKEGLHWKTGIPVILATAIIWGLYLGISWVAYHQVFRLDFSISVTGAVFCIAALGMIVPSAPGNLGTYEAALFFAFTTFGVPQGKAVGFAVTFHLFQLFLSTIPGLVVFLFSDIRLADLRGKKIRGSESG